MKILLATSNHGKVKEIKEFFKDYQIYAFGDILEPFEIEENGTTFQQNAIIKSKAVFDELKKQGLDDEFITLSDDSGISIQALNWRPGVFSARYSDDGTLSNRDEIGAKNRQKVICELHEMGLNQSYAFYTACMAITSKFGTFNAHGFMHGRVIDTEKGDHGFGYDYMFIPNGFDKTTSELDPSIKAQISHRVHALKLISYIIKNLSKIY